MHREYQKLVSCVCNQVVLMNNVPKMWKALKQAVFLATEHGNFKVLKLIKKANPTMMLMDKDNGESILQIAVQHQQENIFNNKGHLGGFKHELASLSTNWQVGLILDPKKVYCIWQLRWLLLVNSRQCPVSGAALQMQHEIQWYKKIEGMVPPGYREYKNLNNLNPRELFSKEHEKLLERGEKWMKDMASYSMVVAGLSATVVFAAAFTVPGGNIGDKGIPIYLNTSSYMIFVVSNALALVSSLTSVLIFLSILTDRYSEEDFLESLPHKLIIGLAMLFFAITSMTTAFSATYFIMLGHQLAWVSSLITYFICFPVLLCASFQLPLLLEMIQSTYGTAL